jgi:Na+/proline symporter
LSAIDWIIAAACLALCFLPAFFFARRSSKNTSEYFAAGRAVPWWLAGLSMVATTFASDTPNLVTEIVRTKGVSGNWVWWAFVLTGLATVFFYARLWRRSRVLTDLEFYELRYSGNAAAVVRGFRAVYLGFFFNCLIMATVNLAACKIAGILFGLAPWKTLLACGLLNVAFAAHSGLWGVLVVDMIQFVLKMTAVIAAAYFAVRAPEVGGLRHLVSTLQEKAGPNGINYLNFLPDFHNHWDIAMAVFIVPVTVSWWSVWYPGAEPGGGSYIAQRMLASRTEKDALGGVLFFNLAHYVLRPWPWILVGLASILVYPQLADIQRAFPHVDPALIKDDIAYPAMLRFLPVGFVGLMVAGLIAANSSTILTHLNWGSSYLVHDFYRRFVRKDAPERHYVLMGRASTVLLFAASSLLAFALDSAKEAFDIILLVGAGTGLLYLVRWFWWRINAWCEVVAMVTSFVASVGWLIAKKAGIAVPEHVPMLVTVGVTTLAWVLTAFLAPATDRQTLIRFYEKVRPAGPGWETIRREEGIPLTSAAAGDKLPLAMVGWVSGCTVLWTALFSIGSILYGRWGLACALVAIFAVSGTVLVWIVNQIWTGADAESEPTTEVASPILEEAGTA